MTTEMTLSHFYRLMHDTRVTRSQAVKYILAENSIPEGLIEQLKKQLNTLKNIPKIDQHYKIMITKGSYAQLDLSYEINELSKDIFYLTHTEQEFMQYLEDLHPNFSSTLQEGLNFFSTGSFHTFITDRDGTINNYCGRYLSSVQSVYNAVFLTQFMTANTGSSVILTSAPLAGPGLVDISIMPEDACYYAGSKGREYKDTKGTIHTFPIEPHKQEMLDKINKKLTSLLNEPLYNIFKLIGSGLQFKFGQTTIARQDIFGSVPSERSDEFLSLIRDIVRDYDPEGNFFRIEDTGKDIEIILTVSSDDNPELKDFDKGDGINFLNKDIPLEMEKGPALICGDTLSDVPMIVAAEKHTSDTQVIFVTEDEALKTTVRSYSSGALFLPEPDILVTLLYLISKG